MTGSSHRQRAQLAGPDVLNRRALGGEAETYPATLLEIAKLAFRRPTLALGFIGIVESRSTLAQRIQRLLDGPTPKSAKLGFSGLTVVLLIGAALLPMARAERRAVVAPPEPAALSPSAAIEIEVKKVLKCVYAGISARRTRALNRLPL